jgi:hypothetical protein
MLKEDKLLEKLNQLKTNLTLYRAAIERNNWIVSVFAPIFGGSGREGYERAGTYLKMLDTIIANPTSASNINRLVNVSIQTNWGNNSRKIILPIILDIIECRCMQSDQFLKYLNAYRLPFTSEKADDFNRQLLRDYRQWLEHRGHLFSFSK